MRSLIGLTLMSALLLALAAHMLIAPEQYSAAGGYQELRGSGGGNAGAALKVILRHSVDAIGTTATAAALGLVSITVLALLWRPRGRAVEA